MSLPKQVAQSWRQLTQQFPSLPAGILVIGFSGGGDSLTLAHAILTSQLHPPKQTILAYLNHQLRPEAAAEAEFARKIGKEWGAAVRVGQADVPALAQRHKLSIEDAARQARYSFLASVAHDAGGRFVAVGHHADDQAETVLMHILRGSGLTGLQGMSPASPLPGAPDLTLLRPLLNVTRQQIETYIRRQELQPRQDATNQELRYLRNRIRHELLPDLRQYNPNISQKLTQLAAAIRDDETYLKALTAAALAQLTLNRTSDHISLNRTEWSALPVALQRRALRRAWQRLSGGKTEIGWRTLEQARQVATSGETGAASTLPNGVILTVTHHAITLSKPDAHLPAINAPQTIAHDPIQLPLPGMVELADGWRIEATSFERLESFDYAGNDDKWSVFISLPADTQLWVRPRLPSEQMQPLGMNGSSASLKKIMNGLKMPAALRPKWPLVATAAHPIWLVGRRLDHRAKIDPDQIFEARFWRLTCYKRQLS